MSVDIKQHTVKLGNRDYVQVSGRVLIAHDGNPEQLSIVTEVVYEDEGKIRVRAAISTRKGTFTGHAESYKSTGSPQEKKTPLEVAETSAIGRALGFAGYAIEGGIASADEVSNAVGREDAPVQKGQPATRQVLDREKDTDPKLVKLWNEIKDQLNRLEQYDSDAVALLKALTNNKYPRTPLTAMDMAGALTTLQTFKDDGAVSAFMDKRNATPDPRVKLPADLTAN